MSLCWPFPSQVRLLLIMLKFNSLNVLLTFEALWLPHASLKTLHFFHIVICVFSMILTITAIVLSYVNRLFL
jgi:hypothetical protein